MLWLSRAELILVLCSGLSDCFSASSHSLPSPFLPEQQNQSREVHFIVLGLLPPPAVAADLLLMSKVARGCHLPRGGSSPCTVGLIFFFFFVQTACPALLAGAVNSVHAFSGKAGFQQKDCVCKPSPFLEGAGWNRS